MTQVTLKNQQLINLFERRLNRTQSKSIKLQLICFSLSDLSESFNLIQQRKKFQFFFVVN